MKLNEIFDTKTRERKVSPKYDIRANIPHNKLGTGAYGYAVPSKSDPHMVKKLARNYCVRGYYSYQIYIKAIVDEKIAQHNPFAPRVFKFDLLKIDDPDLEYKEKYNIDMERLVDMREANVEQLHAMLASISENKYELYDKHDEHHHLMSKIERILT